MVKRQPGSKKTGPNGRDYEKEAKWAGTEEQKKRRAERNRRRNEAKKRGLVKKGDGKHVDHVKGKRRGKLGGPVQVISADKNLRKQPRRG